jgi:hypothetical protein
MEESGEEYIEVDLFDIEIANRLMDTVLKAYHLLSKEAQKALKEIEDLLAEKAGIHKTKIEDVSFTIKELASFSHLSDYKSRILVEELEDAGYIGLLDGANGKLMQYRLLRMEIGPKIELLRPFDACSKGVNSHN